ncbi:uncharacterized protein HaLaN_27534 [Haematococcus lacustris]|uniref:Uncharacterized protein n=1 Tax=Haematococcus lacustris TaxID=44745 RepID=A0A6A0A8M7_HAELA|nr:uncharacterized protein HaLaN_27534 [Haematococcus lacustris]
MWVNMGEYADLAIYHVVDEILDMVKPKTATLITAEDLEVSGMSGCTRGWAEADALWEQAEQVYEGGGGDALPCTV